MGRLHYLCADCWSTSTGSPLPPFALKPAKVYTVCCRCERLSNIGAVTTEHVDNYRCHEFHSTIATAWKIRHNVQKGDPLDDLIVTPSGDKPAGWACIALLAACAEYTEAP